MKAHLAELQHGWVSVVAKTEAYNEAFFDEQKVKDFSKFLRLNPQVGRHFNKRAEEDIEDPDEEKKEEQKDEKSCLMFEMKRKSLSWALLKHEMVAEMTERNIVCESFGPKTVRSVRKTFKETADNFMTNIDKLRQTEIYPHKKCHPACEARGCKWVIAVNFWAFLILRLLAMISAFT